MSFKPILSFRCVFVGAIAFIILGIAASAIDISVSGTVMRSIGVPLRNAGVTITDRNGNARSAITYAYGNFRFEDIAAGQNHTISVRAIGFIFMPSLIAVSDEISGLEIMPEPE